MGVCKKNFFIPRAKHFFAIFKFNLNTNLLADDSFESSSISIISVK